MALMLNCAPRLNTDVVVGACVSSDMPQTKTAWTKDEVNNVVEVYKESGSRKGITINDMFKEIVRRGLNYRSFQSLKSKLCACSFFHRWGLLTGCTGKPSIDVDSSRHFEVPNRGDLIDKVPLCDQFLTSGVGLEQARLFTADLVEVLNDSRMPEDAIEYFLNILSHSWDSKYKILPASLLQAVLRKNTTAQTNLQNLLSTNIACQLLIPLVWANHWSLVELGLDESAGTIKYYDSSFSLLKKDMKPEDCPSGLTTCVNGLSGCGINIQQIVWTDSPQQPEGSLQCGAYLLKTCETVARGEYLQFSAEEAVQLRNQLLSDALTKLLRSETPGLESPHRLRNDGDDKGGYQARKSPRLSCDDDELISVEEGGLCLGNVGSPSPNLEPKKRRSVSADRDSEPNSKKASTEILCELRQRLAEEIDKLELEREAAAKRLEVAEADLMNVSANLLSKKRNFAALDNDLKAIFKKYK